jgi:class 3 adenylate cyclase/HAMP domain-containing protein
MTIRTYLTLSYLALILLLTLGMWAISDRYLAKMTTRDLALAEEALLQATAANYQYAKQVLTQLGEYVVKDKAEDVARELAYVLKGIPTNDYTKLRQNPLFRKVAVQPIFSVSGESGYTVLYDRNGFILFHPDKQVEGHNQLDWEKEYPETTALIKRSFTDDKVYGYFNFFDKDKKERQRYSARMHVPGTPFIAAAVVNIDEFFLPTQEKILKARQETLARAWQNIEKHHSVVAHQVKIGTLMAGLVLCLIGVLSGVLFAAGLARPIRRLRDGVRQVGEGDFSVAVPARGAKEIVHLAESFNQLGKQLTDYMQKRDFIRDTFGRYVTQEVVKRLLESKEALEMGGEDRVVSIIMSDLRGFTAITADMEPQAVITFLNRYLGKMIEILTDYHAVIDEIVGDGILAFFGAPEPMADHPVRAVACALEMQAAMDEINFLNAADGFPHLEMGIAVNTGTVVVGNIGSEQRAKYSVVGSQVNFTSRIEAYAVGGQVLISDYTFEHVKDLIEVGDVFQGEMKGVPEPATIYEVLSITGPYQIRLKERGDTLIPLPRKLPVHLERISHKIITGGRRDAWITQLCETAALVLYEGEVGEWEDVRLHLLDENLAELPGKIYGKVTSVKPLEEPLREAVIRFTSVSPETFRVIQLHLKDVAIGGKQGS